MRATKQIATAMGVLAATSAVAVAAPSDEPGGLPQGSEPVDLDPADFTTQIDNPYWPMTPGSRWVYRETDTEGAKQRVVVTVTRQTKRIANGVEARVVHDVVTENGEPVEVTDDWYAQDADGNIWYLGEDTTEYENGKPVDRRLVRGRRRRGAGRDHHARQPRGRAGLPAGVLRRRGRGPGRGRQPRRAGRGAVRPLHARS